MASNTSRLYISLQPDHTDLLFLLDGERVPVQGADDDESHHEQQQFPVQYLVQTSPPQEQQFGESRAARRRHLGLVADGHRGRRR